MNRNFLLLGVALLTAGAVIAQPYQATSIAYDWVEISGLGINSGIVGDDQLTGLLSIGFSFSFYGLAFNSLRICSDGFITFIGPWSSWGDPNPIPNPEYPNNAIYPLWLDLYPPAGGTVWYYYDAANMRHIIEWDNVMSYATPRTPQKFEIIIHRDGVINLMYHTVQPPCVNASTVGIENATGTEAVQCTFMGSGPLEPASQTGIRISSVTSPVSITMWPYLMMQIPPLDGFYIILHNQTDSTVAFNAWIMLQFPNGAWRGPILGPCHLMLPAGDTIARFRPLLIPASWPAGSYWEEGRVGDYPDVVWDTSGFAFTKLAPGNQAPGSEHWPNTDESFEIAYNEFSTPHSSLLTSIRPNPFNPSTAIRYQLSANSHVDLRVYDISGCLVATLVDGWQDAGVHEVTFDGTRLPSGIYIYRMSAESWSSSGKIILLK